MTMMVRIDPEVGDAERIVVRLLRRYAVCRQVGEQPLPSLTRLGGVLLLLKRTDAEPALGSSDIPHGLPGALVWVVASTRRLSSPAAVDAIDVTTQAGLRDRALIGLMVYSFAQPLDFSRGNCGGRGQAAFIEMAHGGLVDHPDAIERFGHARAGL